MRFWDSSAIVPLLLAEETTDATRELFEQDPVMLVWWATSIECVSAIAWLERQGDLMSESTGHAIGRLEALARAWHELLPGESVRRIAIRLLRVHDLRAADSLQLAAAVVGSENHPGSLELVTLDDRLGAAAEREGFPVLNAADG